MSTFASHCPRDRAVRAARWLAAALLWLAGAAAAAPAPDPVSGERLVYLLQYIAVDYGVAVRDREVADPFEYEEMRRFARLLAGRGDALAERGVSAATREGLTRLEHSIRALAPWPEVRSLASELATALATELDVIALPTAAPDLARGRRFYLAMCASCHGVRGRGDGRAAAGLEPPPTAFHEERMGWVSPHQIYGAVKFGIEGTAMPAYADSLAADRIWDIAFFIMTLRGGFARHAPDEELPLTLADLAQRSNAELLASLRGAGFEVHPSHIDEYRASPASARRAPRAPEPELADPRPDDPASPTPPPGGGLELALALQSVFARVAQMVTPSVVGVRGMVRRPEGDAPSRGGWREGSSEERLYPEYLPARAGSGFLVNDAGHVLTAYGLLTDARGERVELVDVELHDGRHRTARIIGSEPTIDLAVLALDPPRHGRARELQPVRLGQSDALSVGHWTIALGNPAGAGRSFAVGTLASGPERQCYQEDLTATLMQTSLSVPPGAYGGPLVDIHGSVVGMMVPGPRADLGDGGATREPLRFALPIDLAMAIYEPLVQRASHRSPWLGFAVLELESARRLRAPGSRETSLPQAGVYIDDVFDPSPAWSAGVRVGDSLTAIDERRIESVGDFQKWLYLSGIGRDVTLELFRDGERFERRVSIQERPAAIAPR
jgi:S1-C subfamily serine protease/mono/diheme cytochrome c family protein